MACGVVADGYAIVSWAALVRIVCFPTSHLSKDT